MTPEWLTAIASVATFVVIGATAIVTLIQLRHIRNSNQISVFTEIRHRAFRVRLLDPNSNEGRLVVEVGNFLDSAIAPLVKHGMMCWDTLAPFIASLRAMLGYRMWEDFEYLALLCKDFRVRFPQDTYPRRARALPLPKSWPEAAQSVALATAGEPGASPKT